MMPSQPSDPRPTTSGEEPPARPRLTTGLIVLLAALTLVNVAALVVITIGLQNAVDHGDEDGAGLGIFGLVVNLVCLVALGGAWCARRWGPRLYLAAVVVDRLAVLVVMPAAFFAPAVILGLILAMVLVAVAEGRWSR